LIRNKFAWSASIPRAIAPWSFLLNFFWILPRTKSGGKINGRKLSRQNDS
jgi:hypothetical protein